MAAAGKAKGGITKNGLPAYLAPHLFAQLRVQDKRT
jgi:hypothetical protein